MYLVINLAVVDMFNGGFGLVVHLLLVNQFCQFSGSVPFPLLIPVFFFLNASVGSLAAISLERMHATFRPLKHSLIKKRSYGAAITAVWLTAGVSIFFCYFDVKSLLFFLFCYFLMILACYSSIAIKINCGRFSQRHGGGRREKKLTKTLFIVTSASLLLALPFIICLYLSVEGLFYTSLPYRADFYLLVCLFFLFQANSFVNPFLYALRMPGFKRALFSLLACKSQPTAAHVFAVNAM